MKIVKCHLVVLKMWCNIIILHWNDSFCIDMFVLAVLNCQSSFYCKKDFQKPVCSIFGYNTRSMRNNRSIARGSNTSNIFAVTKHTLVLKWQLGWESIGISIWLSMNDVRPIKNYILTYSYLWLIINVTLVAEGIDYAIIITTLKH